jgi:hypothetical protein
MKDFIRITSQGGRIGNLEWDNTFQLPGMDKVCWGRFRFRQPQDRASMASGLKSVVMARFDEFAQWDESGLSSPFQFNMSSIREVQSYRLHRSRPDVY